MKRSRENTIHFRDEVKVLGLQVEWQAVGSREVARTLSRQMDAKRRPRIFAGTEIHKGAPASLLGRLPWVAGSPKPSDESFKLVSKKPYRKFFPYTCEYKVPQNAPSVKSAAII